MTNEILARLIQIGRTEAFHEFQQLLMDFPEARSGQLMRESIESWNEVAGHCSRDEVAALIKALTVAERDLPNFRCGSVSPVIWLYRYLLDSTRDDFTELRDWVVAHTRNHYLPFGRTRFRPASLSEYHRLLAAHEAYLRARDKSEAEALAARRAARQRQRDEQQQVRQRRRQIREAIVASLQSRSAVERLEHIIADVGHPVSFFPAEWAILDSATIQSLPTQLRFDAIQRLADRRKGTWKKLRVQLERYTISRRRPQTGGLPALAMLR